MSKNQFSVNKLHGSSRALIASSISKSIQNDVIVLFDNNDYLLKFRDELEFFLGSDFDVPFGLDSRFRWNDENAETNDKSKKDIICIPDFDIKPYSEIIPPLNIQKQRIAGLCNCILSNNKIILTTKNVALKRIIPKDVLASKIFEIKKGANIDPIEFMQKLLAIGYNRSDAVLESGDFAMRGGILDIFSPLAPFPARIELFGDEIESIRNFSPSTQLTDKILDKYIVIPTSEFLIDQKNLGLIKSRIKRLKRAEQIPLKIIEKIFQNLENGTFTPDCNLISPFFDNPSDFFEYVKPNPFVIYYDSIDFDSYSRIIKSNFDDNSILGKLWDSPNELYIEPAELADKIDTEIFVDYPDNNIIESIVIETKSLAYIHEKISENLALKEHERPFKPFVSEINRMQDDGIKIIIVLPDDNSFMRLSNLLEGYNIDINSFTIKYGTLYEGFLLTNDNLCVITLNEIFGDSFGKTKSTKQRQKTTRENIFAKISIGDFIVHQDFGIGKFLGLKKIGVANNIGDFLELEYKSSDKLYISVDRLNLVKKFVSGDGAEPTLDKLGGDGWQNRKKKVKEETLKFAKELVTIYAKREISKGYQFSMRDEMLTAFESSFAFEETPDQEYAISEVLSDMASSKPMDRLICGDVGFGKTEVALRASARSIFDGKQVALIAPTTVLVMQHLVTAKERFSAYPVRIEGLSRLNSAKNQKETLKDLADGKVDLVIGTHKLLQSRIKFHDLGLVIIDEEHKFGVKDKEKLKELKASVDVLTLTATPIPRTLQMAFVKIRDLSIIQTPPVNRHPIKTFVAPFSEKIIFDAISDEILRGGQIFVVHNRISTISAMADRLRDIIGDVKIAIAHGRMNEKELEKTIIDFMLKKYDILLCTTIIGSGIDMPNVNTIIIDRADKLGLAELYQLRGRVGRASRQAYAYLLIPPQGDVTLDAEERLNAIKRYQELGSGFEIATADLEIRGGGNLLGKNQSGFVNSVGFDLYTEMLNEAISELKGEEIVHDIESEIKLPISAFIPDNFVSDSNQRIELYRRLSNCKNDQEIDDLALEIMDRFGDLPDTLLNLFEIVKIKVIAKELRIKKVELSCKKLHILIDPTTKISSDKLFNVIRKIELKKIRVDFLSEYEFSLNLLKEYTNNNAILLVKNFLKAFV